MGFNLYELAEIPDYLLLSSFKTGEVVKANLGVSNVHTLEYRDYAS